MFQADNRLGGRGGNWRTVMKLTCTTFQWLSYLPVSMGARFSLYGQTGCDGEKHHDHVLKTVDCIANMPVCLSARACSLFIDGRFDLTTQADLRSNDTLDAKRDP